VSEPAITRQVDLASGEVRYTLSLPMAFMENKNWREKVALWMFKLMGTALGGEDYEQ